MNRLCVRPSLRTVGVLVVQLLLHIYRGECELIGSSQPVVAKVGEDVILPCHLDPAVDVSTKTLEWARPELNPRFVYVSRAGQDYVDIKNPSYKGRTSLFNDELKRGNISLKLSNVKPADEGRYRCYFPDKNEESFIELIVGAVSSPVIRLTGLDESSSGVVLQCESKGWYPEPEVLWLDGEGNVLSAGHRETVRGPDDLYTVSSRLTVDKTHGNNITCRVQQNNINQSRETHMGVLVDFFKVQSSSSAPSVVLTAGFAVCITVILLLVCFLWRGINILTSEKKQLHKNGGNVNITQDEEAQQCLNEGNKQIKQSGFLAAADQFIFSPFHRLKRKYTKLQDDIKTSKETEENLNAELTKTTHELQEEKKKRKETEENLNTQLNIKTQELSDKGGKLEANVKELENKINQLEEEKNATKKTDENLKKQLTETTQELEEEKKKRKETEENLKKQLTETTKQLSDKLEENVKELETKINQEEKKTRKETEENLKKQLTEMKKELSDKLEANVKELVNIIHQLQKEIETRKETDGNLKTQLSETTKQLTSDQRNDR